MKWLTEQDKLYLKSKIPLIAESIAANLGSIAKEIGARALARMHQINAGAAIDNLNSARRQHDELLMHHYASHLGYKTSHLVNIMNEYPSIEPRVPLTQIATTSGLKDNPNYALEKREYDNLIRQYRERRAVVRQIDALKKYNPAIGAMASRIGWEAESAKQSLKDADPLIARPKVPRTASGPVPISDKPRERKISDILLGIANAERYKRRRKRK